MYKVMLVEDEELILQGIYKIMDWNSINLQITHLAHDGVEALQMWQEEKVDIIITDINMPEMNGLELLKKIRNEDSMVCFIILSGYDEFDYARKAIPLDVEEYILKPVDEKDLKSTLEKVIETLNGKYKQVKRTITYHSFMNDFLSGKMDVNVDEFYHSLLHLEELGEFFDAALFKISKKKNAFVQSSDLISWLENQNLNTRRYVFYLTQEEYLLLMKHPEEELRICDYYEQIQNDLMNTLRIDSFVTIVPNLSSVAKLPEAYKILKELQKYLLIEGYGTCIDTGYVEKKCSEDIVIDEERIHRILLSKEKEEAIDYVESLFINHCNEENISLDSVYKFALKLGFLLKSFTQEFHLERELTYGMSQVLDNLYHAENIAVIKNFFITEIIEIIDALNSENSQYTPVIKQILGEIKEHYMEEFSLKTFSNKYHMNTSYLGQLFNKEVGISFVQYCTNYRNSMARNMILSTNMRINDIAKSVGYFDVNYFYRKFKQSYGVSPASLRGLKG